MPADNTKIKYSPDQERDDHGRFGSGGGSSGSQMSQGELDSAHSSSQAVTATSKGAAATDHAAAKELNSQLSGNSDYQALSRAINSGTTQDGQTDTEGATSKLMYTNPNGVDHDPASVAMQQSAARVFGQASAPSGADTPSMNAGVQPYQSADAQAGMDAYMQAQYSTTQAALSSSGAPDSVVVYAVSSSAGTIPAESNATADAGAHSTTVDMPPVARVFTDPSVAASMARGGQDSSGTVYAMTVPTSSILRTSNTGIGNMSVSAGVRNSQMDILGSTGSHATALSFSGKAPSAGTIGSMLASNGGKSYDNLREKYYRVVYAARSIRELQEFLDAEGITLDDLIRLARYE